MKILILMLFATIINLYAQEVLYDTTGDKGKAPINGADGSSPGAHGQHAIAPTDAQHSGSINLDIQEVTSSDGQSRFKISGDMKNPDGTIKQQFEHLFETDKEGYILKDHTGLTKHVKIIRANSSGTTAHDGGRGGDGQKGHKGTDGSDATQFSHGGDGGTGGPGGDAGSGTDAAQSGDAGKTAVHVKEDQTHLLMHIEEDTPGLMDGVIKGGKATKAGTHGRPGSGGDGGRGGSSYTWTTTETKTRTVTVTNSDGSTSTDTETYTDTEFHSNPGGSDGSSGPSGRDQTAILKDKPAGKDASFTINIKQADGTITTYKNGRYDLQILQDAKYKSAAALKGIEDGIIEPDEFVEVRYDIKNTSDMPTPKRVAYLAVLDSQGVKTTEVTRKVSIPSLQPGEVFTTDPVFIQAKSLIRLPVKGDAIVEKGQLTPKTTQSGTGPEGAEKTYNRANRTTGFQIQQVARLDDKTDIRAATALVPGKEQTWVEIDVINNSKTIDLGIDSNIPRQLSVKQQFKSIDGISASDIISFDENGKEINLSEQIKTEISKLPPGEKKTIKLKIGIKEGTQAYNSGELLTTLNRGSLTDLLGGEDIQIQDVKIQAVKVFDPKNKPDIILVTNSNTSKEAMQAYKDEMLSKYGKVVEDYNISYYAGLDIDKPPLSELTNNGETTIMILNNEYGAEADQAANRLKLNQTLEAVHKKGMRVMFVGPGSPGSDLATRLSPATEVMEDLEVREHGSQGEFNKAQAQGRTQTSTVSPGTGDRVQVKERFVATRLTDKKLQKQAEAQAQRLNEVNPQGRYVVVTSPAKDDYKKGKGLWEETKKRVSNFFTNRPVGSYTVLRTSDLDNSGISHLKIPTESLNDPSYVKSYDFNLAYLKQLSFEEKLRILDNVKAEEWEKIYKERALFNAIISDLAEEQTLFLKNNSGSLAKLKMLSEYQFKNILPEKGAKFDFIKELTADMNHLNEVAKDGFFDKRYKQSSDYLDDFVKKNPLFGAKDASVRQSFKKVLATEINDRREHLKKLEAENELKIKDARASRREELPWYKKVVSGFMSDPKLDAKGNNLEETLHPIRTNTFVIEMHETSGHGIDTGRNIMPDNVVRNIKTYNAEQVCRGEYDNLVDCKVSYEQNERAKNTGKAISETPSDSYPNGIKDVSLRECLAKIAIGH